LKPIQTNNYLICTAAAGLKGMGRGLQKCTPYLIAAVLKKSPEGYFGNGVYPTGAVFERAYRVETFSIKCEHLLSCFFSPFGDWWKFSSVSSFKYCTYSHLKEHRFR
jgi:hypothetical protein